MNMHVTAHCTNCTARNTTSAPEEDQKMTEMISNTLLFFRLIYTIMLGFSGLILILGFQIWLITKVSDFMGNQDDGKM